MKRKYLVAIVIFFCAITNAQTIILTDYLLYPRLDSTYWEKDYTVLNSMYSGAANKCQTCVFQQTDSTRGRFCFNTSLGHVQLDSTLYNFAPEKLIGEWGVVNMGQFEITDSVLPSEKMYYRHEMILNEKKDTTGHIIFTGNRINMALNNNKDFPDLDKRYKILEGRFLTTKKLSGYCGATMIGLTKDGFLILDDHTFRTVAKKEQYLAVKTMIKRIILKKVQAATNSGTAVGINQ